jgi:hypothetical protein
MMTTSTTMAADLSGEHRGGGKVHEAEVVLHAQGGRHDVRGDKDEAGDGGNKCGL